MGARVGDIPYTHPDLALIALIEEFGWEPIVQHVKPNSNVGDVDALGPCALHSCDVDGRGAGALRGVC